MKTLSIDLETYSSADLSKCGVYKYAESPDFEILLFGYSADGEPVKVIDVANGEPIPNEVVEALTDERCTKWAFNSSFERICLSRYLGYPTGKYLGPSSWRCTMVWSAYMGLPLSLQGVGAVIGLEKQKLSESKELIRYFCQPCAATKANSGSTRNMPSDAPNKWALFKTYNARDVEVEMAIQEKLRSFPVPDSVWDEYHIDQEINDRGVMIDLELARQAIEMDAQSRKELTEAMQHMTALEKPNSVQQMRQWLSENGVETETLGKKAVAELLKTAPEEIRDVLALRLQLAKSSVKKYRAMETAACSDNRARGMFRFYGANRTGRFCGKIVQMQNLPRNHLQDLPQARALVKSGDFDAVKMLYEDVPDTLSQLIRTAFIPKPGTRFIVADYSAIEARVLAFLAGEQWVLDTFVSGGDIYCATASRMFGVPVEKNGVNKELRRKGKQCTLSCGYGGAVGALRAMGALEAGMREDELQPLVDAWREANPNIVRLWWDMDRAVKAAVRDHITSTVSMFKVYCRSGMLFIDLPGGRRLAYVKPRMGTNRFGSECVTYEGTNTGKWTRIESYGPKFVENCTQAVARDILCYAMRNLRQYGITMHIHDELVIEAPPELSLETVCEIMGRTPPWIEGLPLRADGYTAEFYKKE